MSEGPLFLVVLGLLAWCDPATAQDRKWEVTGFAGWTVADGVSRPEGDVLRAPNSEFYSRVAPKDSASLGFGLGRLIGPHAEVGFIYAFQPSRLVFGGFAGNKDVIGTPDFDLGPLAISTFHGYVAFNGGTPNQSVRPILMVGVGFTHYGDVSSDSGAFLPPIQSSTKFSPTFGAGVKLRANRRVGLRIMMRWTPTFVQDTSAGWWCDPNWLCYTTPGEHNIANQFEYTAGAIVRF